MKPIQSLKSVKASKGNLWRFYLLLVAFTALLAGGVPNYAFAHRAHAGLTELNWNEHTQSVEITHRLYAHDLEPRLFERVLSGWEETEAGVKALGEYCAAMFSITVDGKALPLRYVGAEPDGEFIYVYYTAKKPKNGSTLSVYDAILTDVFDDQVNLVNLTLNGDTQSQYFRFGDAAKTFDWTLKSAE
jgi:Domain of unknown function (DUF6702)